MKAISPRYELNPFIGTMEITVKKKRVTIGSGDNVLLDKNTGEVHSTNIVSVQEVDDEKFVKLFTQNISLMLGLTSAGNKAFVFLMWAVQKYAIKQDFVALGSYELADFIKENGSINMSEPTMRRGLSELVKAKIIAHSKKIGVYFINPNFIFNGDRIKFVTEIRRKSAHQKNQEKLEEAGQRRLID